MAYNVATGEVTLCAVEGGYAREMTEDGPAVYIPTFVLATVTATGAEFLWAPMGGMRSLYAANRWVDRMEAHGRVALTEAKGWAPVIRDPRSLEERWADEAAIEAAERAAAIG